MKKGTSFLSNSVGQLSVSTYLLNTVLLQMVHLEVTLWKSTVTVSEGKTRFKIIYILTIPLDFGNTSHNRNLIHL